MATYELHFITCEKKTPVTSRQNSLTAVGFNTQVHWITASEWTRYCRTNNQHGHRGVKWNPEIVQIKESVRWTYLVSNQEAFSNKILPASNPLSTVYSVIRMVKRQNNSQQQSHKWFLISYSKIGWRILAWLDKPALLNCCEFQCYDIIWLWSSGWMSSFG